MHVQILKFTLLCKTPNATYNTPQEAQEDGTVLIFLRFFTNNKIFLNYRKSKGENRVFPLCQADIPVGSIKCQFCTSVINEKTPPQYPGDNGEATKDSTANLAASSHDYLIDINT
ncbi:hypothetical protein Glove_132g300 [Diversispora epigaea]|uniref:Uncharacterized protein n=1 Tax=Diversispora epigaea TaxID=1348612 RepID=A0A397J6L7_9GLOM|nr:hypothetical protein Glove_132g300 [Diversispora epigaea]